MLGVLRGIVPRTLLDIGSGRGVFLWPLLDAFPELPVTAVEPDTQRRAHLEAVRRGGIDRLSVMPANAQKLACADGAFDVVTVLEVLEHQVHPMPLAREAIRVARRFVVVSVPSTPDDNPEHVQLFTGATLPQLLREAGAVNVRIDYVLNHINRCRSCRSPMSAIHKYPRTRHILDSGLQPGDEDLGRAGFEEIAGRNLVVEEKVDGANAAISFNTDGSLLLQSRGHYLTGGARELHFSHFKAWAHGLYNRLWQALGPRYLVHGEWVYAKHTIFYDALPHYFARSLCQWSKSEKYARKRLPGMVHRN